MQDDNHLSLLVVCSALGGCKSYNNNNNNNDNDNNTPALVVGRRERKTMTAREIAATISAGCHEPSYNRRGGGGE